MSDVWCLNWSNPPLVQGHVLLCTTPVEATWGHGIASILYLRWIAMRNVGHLTNNVIDQDRLFTWLIIPHQVDGGKASCFHSYKFLWSSGSSWLGWKFCISEMLILVTWCISSVKGSQFILFLLYFLFISWVRNSAKVMYSASGFLILSFSLSCRSICSGYKRSSRNESGKWWCSIEDRCAFEDRSCFKLDRFCQCAATIWIR